MAGNLTAMIASIFSGSAVVPDEYFEYTTLLLPGNGTNGAQNNTFLDGSTNNFTITRNGNTTQGTFSPFSQTGWGNYFTGASGTYLNTTTNSSAFNLSSGDFTIEAWIYLPSLPSAYSGIISAASILGVSGGFFFGLDSSNRPYIGNGVVLGISGSTAVSSNVWTHIAAVKSGSNLQFYTNGQTNGSPQAFTPNAAGYVYVGASPANSERFTGYISNARVVKGVAVYTSAFTPPTSALTATQSAGTNIAAITTGQTSLLTCQSNRFVDNGQGNTGNTGFTITVNGSPTVQAFSPFNPTASWSAATNGGSGYFDGTGDYLTLPAGTAFAPGTGDFTVDGWFYTTVTTANQIIWSQAVSGTNYFIVWADPSTSTVYFNGTLSGGGVNISSTANLQVNAWNYFSVRRASGTVTVYLNGVAGTPTSNTVDFSNTSYVPTIGRYTHTATNHFTGYIANLRYVKGTAITPSGVPTTLNTAVSGTSALLNFTNAGIFDATSKNDLETVGSTAISTAQSQFGGSSILFSSSYLSYPVQPFTRIGAGDYTFECWVRPSVVSGLQALLSFGSSAFRVFLNSTSLWFLNSASTILQPANVFPTANVWYYVVIVRQGSATNNTAAFINGSRVAQATNTTDFNAGSPTIGGEGASNYLAGYMQDVRLTRYARYSPASSSITVPTAAFPTL